ncbi:hypothetical protein B0H13DRAFT_2043187 [Mycena leptocephala]|nr:hypothetical protein B0H13DRAFT_2043187 [Mycena leptocephala]
MESSFETRHCLIYLNEKSACSLPKRNHTTNCRFFVISAKLASPRSFRRSFRDTMVQLHARHATARTVAATVKPVALSPANVAVAGLININGFQGFGLNLVDNAAVAPGEGTAVFVFPGNFASFVNQEGSNFHIANGLNSSLFLSYPAAAFNVNPYGAELVVFSKFPATFSLQPIGSSGNTVQIVEVCSQLELTSYNLSRPGRLLRLVS